MVTLPTLGTLSKRQAIGHASWKEDWLTLSISTAGLAYNGKALHAIERAGKGKRLPDESATAKVVPAKARRRPS